MSEFNYEQQPDAERDARAERYQEYNMGDNARTNGFEIGWDAARKHEEAARKLLERELAKAQAVIEGIRDCLHDPATCALECQECAFGDVIYQILYGHEHLRGNQKVEGQSEADYAAAKALLAQGKEGKL
jgi:hypothetical protein